MKFVRIAWSIIHLSFCLRNVPSFRSLKLRLRLERVSRRCNKRWRSEFAASISQSIDQFTPAKVRVRPSIFELVSTQVLRLRASIPVSSGTTRFKSDREAEGSFSADLDPRSRSCSRSHSHLGNLAPSYDPCLLVPT